MPAGRPPNPGEIRRAVQEISRRTLTASGRLRVSNWIGRKMRFDMRLMSNGAAIIQGNLIADRRHDHEPKAGEDDRKGNLPDQANGPRSRGPAWLGKRVVPVEPRHVLPNDLKVGFFTRNSALRHLAVNLNYGMGPSHKSLPVNGLCEIVQ